MIVQPFLWLTGIYYIDVFICHVWHGQVSELVELFIKLYDIMQVPELCLAFFISCNFSVGKLLLPKPEKVLEFKEKISILSNIEKK